MKIKKSSFLLFILSLIFPVVVFFLVYRYTDHFFRTNKFPYPFELFGVFVGLGSACWTIAVVKMIQWIIRKFQKPSSSPYTIEQKIKINAVEALK